MAITRDLRDLVNATMGFEALAVEVRTTSHV